MHHTPTGRMRVPLLIGTGALVIVSVIAWRPAVPAAGVSAEPGQIRPATAQAQTLNEPGKPAPPPPVAPPPGAPAPALPSITTYVVQEGDTLQYIASSHNTDVDSILTLNNVSDPGTIKAGTRLRILPLVGVLHRVEPGETVGEIAARYEADLAQIINLNGLVDPGTIRTEQELIIPGAHRVIPRPRTDIASRGASRSSQAALGMHWPLQGMITSPYGPRWGRFHAGIDIAGPTGTPIVAAAAGRVISAGWDGEYGLAVVIEHENGLRTRYAHASVLRVKVGDTVQASTVVAEVGTTGFATGPHLHFEVIDGGVRRDPAQYLP